MPDPVTGSAPTPPPPLGPGPARRLFVGPQGLRALWRVVLFLAAAFVAAVVTALILRYVLVPLFPKSLLATTLSQGKVVEEAVGVAQSPGAVALPAVMLLASVLAATIVMGRIERRSLSTYGFGARRSVRHLGAGMLWGFLALSMLVGMLIITGHMTINAAAQPVPVALEYAAKWGIAFLAVGLFEESISRGYIQATLARGMGFWPAAVLLSVVFGAGHLGNHGETPIGILGAGAAGFVFCYSLWRSGSIWWGVGFHTTWDWTQSYFYGTADSGVLSAGCLFNAHPVGATWMSGGSVGPEGSLLVFLILIAVALVIRWTLSPPPAAPPSQAATQSGTPSGAGSQQRPQPATELYIPPS